MKTTKERKLNLFSIIAITFSASQVCTLLVLLNTIISALIPMLQVLFTAQFINTVINIYNNEASRSTVYKPLIVLILLVTYLNIKGVLMGFVNMKLDIALNEKLETRLIEKKAKLEYWHIENNDTWEMISRVSSDSCMRISIGFKNLSNCINIVAGVLLVLGALFLQVWWASLIIIICYIPLFFLCLKCGKEDWAGFEEANKYDRRADYFQRVLSQREYMEERSLFQYTDGCNDEWQEKYNTARKVEIKVFARNTIRINEAGLLTIFVSVAIVSVLLVMLGKGQLNIGMFIGFITQLFAMIRTISKDLTNVTMKLASDGEYIKELDRFEKLSETEGALDQPASDLEKDKEHIIRFDKVSFQYPGTDKYVLRDFSLTLQPGLHYALVGINGAGKTTIVKLLTGLYKDYIGEIFIDNKNIKEFTQARLKGIFSVVYQDFAKYYVPLKDSIMLGDINNIVDAKNVNDVIKEVKLDDVVAKLPNGIDTPVGKIIEGGIDLSGGEWQRAAIARSVISSAPVRILDEPTAALDPIAEGKVYELFYKISKGKSTIFITHRLGAAKLADEIVLIDGGNVAEQGSHDMLMEKNGIYADMFEKQRSWYK